MLRKILVIFSGNAAFSLLLFIRNLMIARLISVADYGIAATFAIVMTAIEMASELGLRQQIVQSRDGNSPRFQAALQAFQLMRGIVMGGALFFLATPLAQFFGIPEVAWAYQLLALVPILRAAEHMDIHRMNREMRFGPMMMAQVVPAAIALAVVWPLAWAYGDWRVMLYSLLLQVTLATLATHLLAERRYGLVWDRAIIAGSLRFGWPLLVNGALMFLVFQGDKMIVGRLLGLEPLALFAMGVTLTLTPTLVMARSTQNLFLPRLSQAAERAKADPQAAPRFQKLAMATLQMALLNGAVLVLAVVWFGEAVLTAILGSKYADLVPLLGLFALLHAMRVFKTGSAVVSLSRGVSSNAMIGNLPRLLALPVAVWLLLQGGSLQDLLWLGILAEAAGFILALWLVQRRVGIVLRPLVPAAIGVMVFLGLALWGSAYLAEFSGLVWASPVLTGIGFVGLILSMKGLHGFLRPRA